MPAPHTLDAAKHLPGPDDRRVRKPLGYSLIEVIAALSLLSLLATSAVTILAAATDTSTQHVRARQDRRDIQRLAETFRTDASNTLQVSIPKTVWPMTLEQEGSTVLYHWDELRQTLTREVKEGQTSIRFERYLMPKTSNPRILVVDRQVTLQIDLPGNRTPWVIQTNLKGPGK